MQATRVKLSPAEKIDRVRAAYAAFDRGDIPAVVEQFADGAVWHGRGTTRYGGDRTGRQAILEFLSQIPQDFEEFKLEIHDVLANDEHVAVLLTSRFRRHGQTYEDDAVHVSHVNDEGKTTEIWFAADTEQLMFALEH